VRGELDWIVMKALEKDRNRRYETASSLATDLRRYLDDEPVQACPPSARYRLRKFARRHRAALATVTVLLLVLVGLAGLAVLAHRNRLAERRLLAERRALELRLLLEKRCNTLDRAVVAAMAGDFDEAESAIGQAELLGASTGQIRMLRGQVAYHEGDLVSAKRHLEQAVKLMPETVAAKALLARAYYFDGGQTADMERLWRDLDRMAPSTPEDYLFKGQVEALIRPEAGLWLLDEAVRRRNTVIARGERGEARANRALASGEAQDAVLALEDAAAARAMLPDNTFTLASSVYAQLVAAGVYEAQGRTEERRRVLDQAGRDVQKLRGRTTSQVALKVCFWFFELVGDERAAFEISRQATGFRHALMLYRRGEYEGALRATELTAGRGYSLARIERAFILAEIVNGPAKALAVAKDASDHPGDSLFARLCPPHVLLLLGRREDAARAALRNRQRHAAVPFWYDDWYPRYLDYQCGSITEGSLLDAAAGSRTKLCEALFLIGLRHLAEGDRAGARERFRRCVQTRVFIFWDYDWARTFLNRMQKDPSWPPWIPKVVDGKDRSEVWEPERSARVSVPR
jgi:tetratricopeptide (TPR) repeat protein